MLDLPAISYASATRPRLGRGVLRGRRPNDDEPCDGAAEAEARQAQARARHAEATRSDFELGHDIRAGLMDARDSQLRALRQIVCYVLVRHYGERRDAVPAGDGALRAAVWEFMRPMLSPALVALNRDAFVVDGSAETTVDLDGHRAASDLEELALDDEPNADAA